MTPYRRRQTPITQRMAEDMLVRNFAERTIDSYTYHVDRLARHFGKWPEDLGPEEIREFQLWMIQVNQSSWSQFNQAVCALRFLYSVTLRRDWAAFECHDSKDLQVGRGKSADQQTGHASYAASFVRDGTLGSEAGVRSGARRICGRSMTWHRRRAR